ncbi:unnamed protein product [Blepharisma stoltei]|uniref:Uncharacterized protein n=1 Tax=Blepharisma stoltei TaxID=1481888 RepID=A0AAU9JE57_9CILI|nr:unnamed protein product [Blepharisma stoltei]
MRTLEKNIPTGKEDEIESSKLSWFINIFRDTISVNLETFKVSTHNIPMLNHIAEKISVCPFPGNKSRSPFWLCLSDHSQRKRGICLSIKFGLKNSPNSRIPFILGFCHLGN